MFGRISSNSILMELECMKQGVARHENEEQCLKTRVPSVNHGLPTPVQHLWLPEELVKKEAGVAFGLIKNVMIRGQGGE